jgi:hypothetical protein
LNEFLLLVILEADAQVLEQGEQQARVLDAVDVVEVLIASSG